MTLTPGGVRAADQPWEAGRDVTFLSLSRSLSRVDPRIEAARISARIIFTTSAFQMTSPSRLDLLVF